MAIKSPGQIVGDSLRSLIKTRNAKVLQLRTLEMTKTGYRKSMPEKKRQQAVQKADKLFVEIDKTQRVIDLLMKYKV